MREVISTVYELADLGITVVPVKSQTGPINSTMGKLLWAIQAWFAEMENEERSETIKAGQARARAAEKQIGRPKVVFDRNRRGGAGRELLVNWVLERERCDGSIRHSAMARSPAKIVQCNFGSMDPRGQQRSQKDLDQLRPF